VENCASFVIAEIENPRWRKGKEPRRERVREGVTMQVFLDAKCGKKGRNKMFRLTTQRWRRRLYGFLGEGFQKKGSRDVSGELTNSAPVHSARELKKRGGGKKPGDVDTTGSLIAAALLLREERKKKKRGIFASDVKKSREW